MVHCRHMVRAAMLQRTSTGGGPVFVHCNSVKGRSDVRMAFSVSTGGMPYDHALEASDP